MPKIHELVEGECVESVALLYGFHPTTIWEHPENADLREVRISPHVLVPGDEIYIPDKGTGRYRAETNHRYRFRRKGVPAKLRLRLEHEGDPRAGVAYVLRIDNGAEIKGKSDDEGKIEHWLPPDARAAVLVLETGEEYQLQLGRLLPVEDIDGVRARLQNLGYGDPEDDDALFAALVDFQRDQDMEPTGILDRATLNKILEVHAS